MSEKAEEAEGGDVKAGSFYPDEAANDGIIGESRLPAPRS